MRLRSLEISDSPPVRQFAVDNLSNVVVFAGPNGVGKTRLINSLIDAFRNPGKRPQRRIVMDATSDEERQEWGKPSLDTSTAEDAQKLRQTLQKKRSRNRMTSSILHFESDRSIQQVQPYTFSWDIVDPFLEAVGWETGFGGLRDRFQDTVHSIFRKVQSRRNDIANKGEELMRLGQTRMDLDFPDPTMPFKAAFSQLLAPKQLLDPEGREQRLYYEADGQRFQLDTLSSGEREVVNIVFDFILRNPSHSIVIFDEPELHLHPELSYRLLQTLQTVGEQNQFIFCTHSPEIITASLDNSVVFISPPKDPPQNQAIPVREDDETHQALQLLGQSIGIVALGRRIVLVEGADTSLDKQLYGSILKNRYPKLVLVPSGGKHVIQSFETVVASILNKTIWGVEFFMLCDRDAAPVNLDPAKVQQGSNGRLRILPRYHLENYFLDERVLAEVFKLMEPGETWLTDPVQIRAALRELARESASYAVALSETAAFRQAVGNVDLMPKGAAGKSLEELSELMRQKAQAEVARVSQLLEPTAVTASIEKRMKDILASLDADDDAWKSLIPGRQLLNRFANKAGIDVGRLKTLYIGRVESLGTGEFDEIVEIFDSFAR